MGERKLSHLKGAMSLELMSRWDSENVQKDSVLCGDLNPAIRHLNLDYESETQFVPAKSLRQKNRLTKVFGNPIG